MPSKSRVGKRLKRLRDLQTLQKAKRRRREAAWQGDTPPTQLCPPISFDGQNRERETSPKLGCPAVNQTSPPLRNRTRSSLVSQPSPAARNPPTEYQTCFQESSLVNRQNLLCGNASLQEEVARRVTEKQNYDRGATLIVDQKTIMELGGCLRCPDCDEDRPAETIIKYFDIDVQIEVRCRSCAESLYLRKPCTVGPNNMRLATACLTTNSIVSGSGYAGLEKLMYNLNLEPNISSFRYRKYKANIGKRMIDMYEQQRETVHESLRNAYEKRDTNGGEDEVLDIEVFYDGSWLTRGHKSNFGIGFVIEAKTGLVVDYEVLSRYCQKCHTIEQKYANDPDRLEENMQRHEFQKECLRNYTGPPGDMEKEAAIRLWYRSIEDNMRYTTLIDKRDSSIHTALVEHDPYNGIALKKQERVDRLSKPNPNESILGKVWAHLSKSKYYGLQTVREVVALTCLEHNVGYAGANVLASMGFADLEISEEWERKFDKERLKSRTRKETKKRRTQQDSEDSDSEQGNY